MFAIAKAIIGVVLTRIDVKAKLKHLEEYQIAIVKALYAKRNVICLKGRKNEKG